MSSVCGNSRSRRRALIVALSVVGHGALLSVLVGRQPDAFPAVPERPVMTVSLAPPWIPTPPPGPAPPTTTDAKTAAAPQTVPAPAPAVPQRRLARPARNPTAVPTILAGDPGHATGIGASLLAGAAMVGSGQGEGTGCNMLRRLQEALRKDRRVQDAVGEVDHAGALMVWNGDWVRHPGQDGAGLAAVREAILWEVGFAPPACRVEPVKGLVVVTMSDAPGAARLALGSGTWRWRDLLFAGSRGSSR